MANWTLLWPSGAPYKQVFPSSYVVQIDEFLTKVPNWIDGSDHTLGTGNQVVLRGGDGLYVVSALKADKLTATVDPATAGIVVPSGGELTVQSGGVQTIESGGSVEVESGGAINAADGSFVRLQGRKRRRDTLLLSGLASGNLTVDVTQGDKFELPPNPAAPRTITLKDTSPAVPEESETMKFFVYNSSAGPYAVLYTFKREGASNNIATFVGGPSSATCGFYAEFEFRGGVWRLCGSSGAGNDGTNDFGVIPGADA